MDFSTLYFIYTPLALLSVIILLVYCYATRNFLYWDKKKVPFLKPLPFIGNLKEVVTFKRNIGLHLKHVYDSMKDEPYKGFFMFDQPVLMVKDLTLLKLILQKDFQHFVDKGITLSKEDKLLRNALFTLKGKVWKSTRSKISPAFSSSKLKLMYCIVDEKAKLLVDYLENSSASALPVLTKDLFGRYTTDVVAAIAFGLESNSVYHPDSEFRKNLKNSFFYSKIGALKFIGSFVDLPLLKLWPVITTPLEVVYFFQKSVWNVVQQRQNQLETDVRNDYLKMLMEVSNHNTDVSDIPGIFSDLDIVSQAYTFLAAGFETTSSTILYLIYHLALDINIQNKLRHEIQDAVKKSNGILQYEDVCSLHFLDMVVSETLRLYPTMPIIDRTCTMSYTIPGTSVTIDKGTHVFTSLLGIQRDPKLYHNPDQFDPEHFSEESIHSRPKFSYMPFGEGPRICIGKRMGLMVVKNAICRILLEYDVLPCKNTPSELKFDVHTFLLSTSHEIPLIFKKIM